MSVVFKPFSLRTSSGLKWPEIGGKGVGCLEGRKSGDRFWCLEFFAKNYFPQFSIAAENKTMRKGAQLLRLTEGAAMLGFTENGVMKRFIHLAAALVSLSATSPLGQAKSDTDVYMIKAEKVTFEKDKVTIVGSAKIKMVVIKADHDPSYKGQQIWGRPSSWVHAKADKATFVIHKPKPQIIKNEKLRPKNYEQVLKSQEMAWQTTLQAAKDVQAGKPVGRIGFYKPTVTIRHNLVNAINGSGYMYGKLNDYLSEK